MRSSIECEIIKKAAYTYLIPNKVKSVEKQLYSLRRWEKSKEKSSLEYLKVPSNITPNVLLEGKSVEEIFKEIKRFNNILLSCKKMCFIQ